MKQNMKHKDSEYNIGDLVYFHGFVQSNTDKSHFLCKGYITRKPNKQSPVYKVIVISVNSNSLLGSSHKKNIEDKLLGKTIAKKKDELILEITNMFTKLYKNPQWINVKRSTLDKILLKLDKARKTNGQ